MRTRRIPAMISDVLGGKSGIDVSSVGCDNVDEIRREVSLVILTLHL